MIPTRIAHLFLLTFVLALTGALAPAEEAPEGEEAAIPPPSDGRPQLTVPVIETPPGIDGRLDDAVWARGSHIGRLLSGLRNGKLETRPARFSLVTDGSFLYIGKRSGVHPERGSAARQKPRPMRNVPHLTAEDSLELWFDVVPGDPEGMFFQFLVNTLGAQADTMFERKFNNERRFWRPKAYRFEGRVEGDTWTLELALPLEDLGIEGLPATLGARFIRNFGQIREGGGRGTHQARWSHGVKVFHDGETMGQIHLRPGGPAVREKQFEDEAGIAVAIEVVNPGSQPLELDAALAARVGEEEVGTLEERFTLAAHERRTLTLAHPAESGASVSATLHITGADPEEIHYHREVAWTLHAPAAWQPWPLESE